jgi:hypothetical protein
MSFFEIDPNYDSHDFPPLKTNTYLINGQTYYLVQSKCTKCGYEYNGYSNAKVMLCDEYLIKSIIE